MWSDRPETPKVALKENVMSGRSSDFETWAVTTWSQAEKRMPLESEEVLETVRAALLNAPVAISSTAFTDSGSLRLLLRPTRWPESCRDHAEALQAAQQRVLHDLHVQFPLFSASVGQDPLDGLCEFLVVIPSAIAQKRRALAIVRRYKLVRGLLLTAVLSVATGLLLVGWNVCFICIWWWRSAAILRPKDEV